MEFNLIQNRKYTHSKQNWKRHSHNALAKQEA